MTADFKQKIQLVLLAGIVIAGARTGYILYERHAERVEPATTAAAPLNPDYYVTPKKLHPYDVKSARQLTEQPVWVREGYYYTYYPYDPARKSVEFAHPAGLLGPLEKLQIKDVVTAPTPGEPGQKQVMATFERSGESYAFPIGMEQDGNFRIDSDDILYIQDPHELYKHWPPEIWQAIDSHQVKPGMNELQVSFAIGYGTLESSGDSRTLKYPNGGQPITITYEDGKAAQIKPGH
jgi:hypothetical protein